MASNGLVTNPSKTAFIIINLKDEQEAKEIKIGNALVKRDKSAKLLGMTFQDNLKWSQHINGKNGTISALNQRLFVIRRLKSSLSKKALCKVADSIFNSKIRYGLQLMGNDRFNSEDPQNQDILSLQKLQNKLLRTLYSVKLLDCVNTDTLLDNVKMLSVNRLNAQIKLTEGWKALNIEGNNLNIAKPKVNQNERGSRSVSQGTLKMTASTVITQNTFINDCKKVWNLSSIDIKNCKSLYTAKKAIKIFVNTLPM